MSSFTTGENSYDAATNEALIDAELEASITGYEPARAGLSYWQKKAFARIMANVGDQSAETKASMFKRFGQTIANVPTIQAAPATVTSTWTVIDEAGHTIPDGTEVKIPSTGDEALGFVVVGDVTIAPGDTSTAAGEVLLQAIEPGEAGNGLSAEPTPVTPLAFIDTITLEGVTSGGVDEEDEDDYLDRLTEELQLLSLSLVVPRDFEIDARSHAGVARALCIPGYNAETETEDVPLCVTVVPVTAAGLALSAPSKEALQASQAAKVPSGVLNFVDDPTYTEIHLKVVVAVLSGFDPAEVVPAVQAGLSSYLSPANWGLPSGFGDAGNSAGWVNADTLYRNELIAQTDRIGGVDRVVTLELSKEGDPLGTADVALAGIAPLTKPGKVEVSAA